MKKNFIYAVAIILALALVWFNMAYRQSPAFDPDHFCAADSDIYRYQCQRHLPLKIARSIPVLSTNGYYLVFENLIIVVVLLAGARLLNKTK